MTKDDVLEVYLERLAICLESDVPEERARELATDEARRMAEVWEVEL